MSGSNNGGRLGGLVFGGGGGCGALGPGVAYSIATPLADKSNQK